MMSSFFVGHVPSLGHPSGPTLLDSTLCAGVRHEPFLLARGTVPAPQFENAFGVKSICVCC